MIESVNKLTNTQDCDEAIVIQERPRWLLPVAIVAAVAAAALVRILLADSVLGNASVGVIGGGTAALVIVSVTKYWILARTGQSVVLADSSKMWSFRAKQITKVWSYPVHHESGNAIVSKKLTIDGEQYYVARQFASRMRTILGG